MRSFDEILDSGRFSNVERGEDGFRATVHLSGYTASIIVSSGAGWEHASIQPMTRKILPSWEDMCKIKDMIWNPEEAVIQIHPAEADYVNFASRCLHLWRCTYKEMVLPPSCLVGPRKGQTRFELEKEIREAYRMAGEEF